MAVCLAGRGFQRYGLKGTLKQHGRNQITKVHSNIFMKLHYLKSMT
ncbi:hypothetical protein LHGZ1_1467 [Laribacter hongkongensis]|uniref:Uncharacterized protein n=1 Tax=Laribacter hongkongensis TaxID=168471 RepID=A0A248LHS5_9NEIS|nr:hypothetical protein LHGZ1_1467 [Laribacter hongkongensis]